MRIAYADPPYPGMSAKHYGDHPDYAGEVDHAELVERLERDYDGWILHTATTTLAGVLAVCPPDVRVLAWVKPFCAWKRNNWPAYAWEPVLIRGGRNQYGSDTTPRDWLSEPMSTQRGLVGAKPQAVVWWLLDCVGAEPDDDLHDLYPGSGAVGRAWEAWRRQTRIADPPPEGRKTRVKRDGGLLAEGLT